MVTMPFHVQPLSRHACVYVYPHLEKGSYLSSGRSPCFYVSTGNPHHNVSKFCTVGNTCFNAALIFWDVLFMPEVLPCIADVLVLNLRSCKADLCRGKDLSSYSLHYQICLMPYISQEAWI